jgi:DNA primase
MAVPRPPVRAGDFYRQEVLPALAQRLDQAFPEFGWRHDPRGWTATNQQFTHAKLGVRADRVVAHGDAPSGFLVHGGEPVPWTAYLNNGSPPRGADFVRTVKELAERAGVDPAPLVHAQPRDRRADLLETFFQHCQHELGGERGNLACAYLEGRGLPPDAIPNSGLGVVPPAIQTGRLLEREGYQLSEIAAAAVLADKRWPGRLCGAWRNEHGRVGTLWARTLDDTNHDDSRYLYLKGASRTDLPPYGLADLLRRPPEARRELVLVEGLIDVHQLRAHGIDNVAALGGTAASPHTFEHLHGLGIETVTLCLDNDDAGRRATARAIENATRARQGPDIYVIDPARMSPAKDPDELIRQSGDAAWARLLDTRSCGITWRAHRLAAVSRDAPLTERRAALARAGRWLGTLPPRLALEQEDAVRLIAEQCGYSREAATRAFRARFWRAPEHDRQPDSCRIVEQALER